jgi:hypothetical protein
MELRIENYTSTTSKVPIIVVYIDRLADETGISLL